MRPIPLHARMLPGLVLRSSCYELMETDLCHVQKTLILYGPAQPLAFTTFLPSLPYRSPSLGRGDSPVGGWAHCIDRLWILISLSFCLKHCPLHKGTSLMGSESCMYLCSTSILKRRCFCSSPLAITRLHKGLQASIVTPSQMLKVAVITPMKKKHDPWAKHK